VVHSEIHPKLLKQTRKMSIEITGSLAGTRIRYYQATSQIHCSWLGPIQPPIQWVQGALSPRVKRPLSCI